MNQPVHVAQYDSAAVGTIYSAAGRPSRITALANQKRYPSVCLLYASHSTEIRAKTAKKYIPDHLLPQLSPSNTAAARRHHEKDTDGPARFLEF